MKRAVAKMTALSSQTLFHYHTGTTALTLTQPEDSLLTFKTTRNAKIRGKEEAEKCILVVFGRVLKR